MFYIKSQGIGSVWKKNWIEMIHRLIRRIRWIIDWWFTWFTDWFVVSDESLFIESEIDSSNQELIRRIQKWNHYMMYRIMIWLIDSRNDSSNLSMIHNNQVIYPIILWFFKSFYESSNNFMILQIMEWFLESWNDSSNHSMIPRIIKS